jgi:hypothetical protein
MAAKGKAKGRGATRGAGDKLRKELLALIDQVDTEGLVFLIRQAQTIIHNLQVERINAEIGGLNQERARALEKASRGAASPAGGVRAAGSEAGVQAVEIEEGAGRTTFIVAIGNVRKSFGLDEMRALARVAHAASDDADGAQRLYTWLKRNRGDVLTEIGARTAAHPALVLVHRAVKSRYKPSARGV